MIDRLRNLPTWLWLGAIVAASFVLRAWLSRHMLAPFIMTDELVYSEIAKSMAAHGTLEVRGFEVGGYGPLFALVTAPAYLFFDSLTEAYAAVKVINSLVMSLAAVPAYLIARRVVSTWLALLAALLAVALPSLAYTATVMTENLFYPLTLLTAWVALRALERPTWLRSLVLLGSIGLALATRSQAVALAAAAATAPLLVAVFDPDGLRRLRGTWRLHATLLGPVLLVLALQLARGRSLTSLLGAYEVVGQGSYDVESALRYWLWHLEELTLYAGVVPVAATLVLLAHVRTLPARARDHLAVTVAFLFWTSLVVAVFASRFAGRIQERNLFTVVPLMLVALLVWVERGAPRPFRVAIPAAGVALLLPLLFPYSRFIDESAKSDTLAILPLWSAFGRLPFDSITATVLLGAGAAVALFLFIPVRLALLVPLAVLLWFGVVATSVWSGPRGFVQAGAGALFQGIRGVPRNWIDTTLPDGAKAGIVWTGITDRFTVNENEFFNRAVGPVYYIGGPTPGNLPETEVRVDPADGILRRLDGSPLTDRYLVTDTSLELDGKALARDVPLGLTLWRVAGPAARRAEVSVTGLYPNDTWSGPRVQYERRRCSPGSLQVVVHSDASLFDVSQTVEASVRGRTVGRVRFRAPGEAMLHIPLRPVGGTCRVTFGISPTAVPGVGDDRRLGVHFDAFNYDPR